MEKDFLSNSRKTLAMADNIPEEIKQISTVVASNPRNYIKVLNSKGFMGRYANRLHLIDYIYENTHALDDKDFNYSLKTRIWWLLNNVSSWNDPKVQCKACHKPIKNWNVGKIAFPYKSTCCKECRYKYGEEQIQKTMQDKYGVKNSFQLLTTKNKDEVQQTVEEEKLKYDGYMDPFSVDYIPIDDKRLQAEFAYYKRHPADYFPKAFSHSRNFIVRCFQQHSFYKKEIELWQDYDIRMKLIANRCKYLGKEEDELTMEDILAGFKKSAIWYGYSLFNPLFMKWFVRKFNCKCLYDPCGGWGHRLLGSTGLDKYIYNDLSKATKDNVDRIVAYFGLNEHVDTYCKDARTFMPKDDFDSMFTCPPYFNLEQYECDAFKDEKDFESFIDSLFDKFNRKESCKVFGLVVRDDMLYSHTDYAEKLLVGQDAKSHLHKKAAVGQHLYIYKKS